MRTLGKGSFLAGLGLSCALAGTVARAAGDPLLVVVEAPPALEVDAAVIRHAIGAELRTETIAPLKTPTEPPDRALIVALDGGRITMSLRMSDAAPIVRSIAAPPDPAARLRAIAWLAGNLARDQVSPIIAASAPAAASIGHPAPGTAPGETTKPPSPIAALSPTQPTPMSETPTIASRPELQRPNPTHWSIGIADGPTTNSFLCSDLVSNGRRSFHGLCAPLLVYGSAWRIEVQRRPSGSGFFWGAAAEGTAGSQFAPQLVGLSAFIGSAKRRGRWTLESSAGAGLELAEAAETTTTATYSSTDGFASTVTTSLGNGTVRPALSADAAVALAHPLGDSLDAVLRLGAHLSTLDLSNWYLSSTIGLRYNLP